MRGLCFRKKLEVQDSKIPQIFVLFFKTKLLRFFLNNDVLFIILLNSTRHKNECSISEHVLKLQRSFQKEKHTFALLKYLNNIFMLKHYLYNNNLYIIIYIYIY